MTSSNPLPDEARKAATEALGDRDPTDVRRSELTAILTRTGIAEQEGK